MSETDSPHETMPASDAAAELNPYADRALEVARAIDPDDSLPRVELVHDPGSRARGASEKYLILHGDQRVGTCVILTDTSLRMRSFGGINIDPPNRGQGFATATYKTAIEDSVGRGFGFATHDWTQNEGTKAVWEKLAARGVARVVEPFTAETDPKQAGRYRGRYVIDAVK